MTAKRKFTKSATKPVTAPNPQPAGKGNGQPPNKNIRLESCNISYAIMTESGWKPIPVIITLERVTMHNPFRGYQDTDYPSFDAWIRNAG